MPKPGREPRPETPPHANLRPIPEHGQVGPVRILPELLACIDQLWRARSRRIADNERAEAERAYEQARAYYRRVIGEASAAR